jgi:di/tricarboxylate transporter
MFSAPAGWASLNVMAKIKSARPKKDATPAVRGGLPCVIFILLAILLVMVFLYLVMSHAS